MSFTCTNLIVGNIFLFTFQIIAVNDNLITIIYSRDYNECDYSFFYQNHKSYLPIQINFFIALIFYYRPTVLEVAICIADNIVLPTKQLGTQQNFKHATGLLNIEQITLL